MTNLWPVTLLLCSFLLGTTAGEPSYWLIFSKAVRSGSKMAVGVHITGVTEPVFVRLELVDFHGLQMQEGQTFKLNPDEGFKTINFELSEKLKKPEQRFFLHAVAWGGIQFNQFEQLVWRNRRATVFLQTDRRVYKPGQTMKFRALTMLPDTTVSDEPMEVVIRDPLNNKIASWSRKAGDGKAGVLEGEMPIPLEPRLGEYEIRAKVKGASRTKDVTIQEYDFPDFELLLWFPRVTREYKTVTAKIFGKYLTGTPVAGSGTLTAEIHVRNVLKIPKLTKKFTLGRYGEAVVTFSIKELKQAFCEMHPSEILCRYKRLRVQYYLNPKFIATIKDSNSHQVVTKTKDLEIDTDKSYLSFTSSTPENFKPGLPLYAYVQDQRANGKPNPNPRNKSLSFTVTYRNGSCNYCRSWYTSPKMQTLLQETVDLDLETSTAEFRIPAVPNDACCVKIEATNGKYNGQTSLPSYKSLSGAYLHLDLDKDLSVGKKRRVTLMSNTRFGDYTYHIYSKGDLVAAQRVNRKVPTSEASFSFNVTTEMAPVAHIVAYFTTQTGEVVADGMTLPVEHYPYEVSLLIDGQKERTRPTGEKITLVVKAAKNTTVFLLGRDDRMLTKPNDLKMEDITKGLMAHDATSILESPKTDNEVYKIFLNTGLGIITNLELPGRGDPSNVPRSYQRSKRKGYYPSRYVYYCQKYTSYPGPPVRKDTLLLKPAERTEEILPDLWLWSTAELGNSTRTTVKIDTPDTITSLTVSAFAVHQKMGLTVAKDPALLKVEKRLFLSMYMPDTAVLGEVVCFNAVAHNTDDKNHAANMKIDRSTDYDVVKVEAHQGKVSEDSGYTFMQKSLGKIESGVIKKATFCIKPKRTGNMDVRVAASADDGPWDELKRSINIKRGGVARSKSYPVLIDLTSDGKFSSSVAVELPDNVVEKSYRVSVAVTGDILGLVADKLGDLLNMPHGSGIQNMIHMAVSTHVIAYLKETKRLTPDIQAKAKNMVQTGYHQQLMYQRYDGSFSAFGNSDDSGSMWLTAFVAKSFIQATALGEDIINLEPDVIRRAIGWITQYQKPDGSFTELQNVSHSLFPTGSAASELRSTAYVVITFVEAENKLSRRLLPNTMTRVSEALPKAVAFLEAKLSGVGNDDPYTACILSYALSLAGSKKAKTAVKLMQKTAVTDGKLKYWSGESKPQSIEMSSYALLTLVKEKERSETVPVFRWLNKQRGPNGGFVSTLDTVIGVEALSAMTKFALQDDFSPIDVTFKVKGTTGDTESSQSVTVTKGSAVLPQRADLGWPADQKPGQIVVEASSSVSKGKRVFAFAEVVVDYNVNGVAAQGLEADVSVTSNTVKAFQLKTCINRESKSGDSPVIVAEIDVPTGYQLNKTSSKYGSVSRAQVLGEKVVLYYFKYMKNSCSNLVMDMSKGTVAYVQSSFIRVYNYYNPGEEHVVRYNLTQYGVCDVNPDEENCTPNNEF